MSASVKPLVLQFDKTMKRLRSSDRRYTQGNKNSSPIRLNMKNKVMKRFAPDKISKDFSISVTAKKYFSLCEITEGGKHVLKTGSERSKLIEDFFTRKKTSYKMPKGVKSISCAETDIKQIERTQNIYYCKNKGKFQARALKTFLKVPSVRGEDSSNRSSSKPVTPRDNVGSSVSYFGNSSRSRNDRKYLALPSIKKEVKYGNCISIQTDDTLNNLM